MVLLYLVAVPGQKMRDWRTRCCAGKVKTKTIFSHFGRWRNFGRYDSCADFYARTKLDCKVKSTSWLMRKLMFWNLVFRRSFLIPWVQFHDSCLQILWIDVFWIDCSLVQQHVQQANNVFETSDVEQPISQQPLGFLADFLVATLSCSFQGNSDSKTKKLTTTWPHFQVYFVQRRCGFLRQCKLKVVLRLQLRCQKNQKTKNKTKSQQHFWRWLFCLFCFVWVNKRTNQQVILQVIEKYKLNTGINKTVLDGLSKTRRDTLLKQQMQPIQKVSKQTALFCFFFFFFCFALFAQPEFFCSFPFFVFVLCVVGAAGAWTRRSRIGWSEEKGEESQMPDHVVSLQQSERK